MNNWLKVDIINVLITVILPRGVNDLFPIVLLTFLNVASLLHSFLLPFFLSPH